MYAFIVDGMRHITSDLDSDRDLWPEGNGIAERPGMGAEQVDVTASTWQALRALTRMATSRGDDAIATWDEAVRLSHEPACRRPAEVSSAFSFVGFGLHSAQNGQEALDWLQQNGHRPCVVLLDLMMPVLDGRTFLARRGCDPSLSKVPVSLKGVRQQG